MTVKVFTFGSINNKMKDAIINIINETLDKLGIYDIYIEVLIFKELNDLKRYRDLERSIRGIEIGDIFFAMHDAWMGYPRIFLCEMLANKMPHNAFIGGIRHEVGHAILHGSIQYYVFSPTDELLNIAGVYGLTEDFLTRITYLISIAVKDYEVTDFLIKNGFKECQFYFIKEVLKVTDDERAAWRLAWNKYMRLNHILTILKAYTAAKPLMNDSLYGEEICDTLNESMSYLPDKYKKIILYILDKIEKLPGDTWSKISKATEIVTNALIKPILEEPI